MKDEGKELEERIRKVTDEKLLEMVLANSSEYTEEALLFAKAEVDKRGGLEALKEKIDRERESRVKQEKMAPEQREEHTAFEAGGRDTYHFKTLLGYGRFISGMGWLVVALGAVVLVLALSALFGSGGGGLAVLGAVPVAILAVAFGVGMVASGQLLSCFVSIERNTRITCEILKQKTVLE